MYITQFLFSWRVAMMKLANDCYIPHISPYNNIIKQFMDWSNCIVCFTQQQPLNGSYNIVELLEGTVLGVNECLNICWTPCWYNTASFSLLHLQINKSQRHLFDAVFICRMPSMYIYVIAPPKWFCNVCYWYTSQVCN